MNVKSSRIVIIAFITILAFQSCKKDEITDEINQAGITDFNVDQSGGVIPLTVIFTDSSTNNPTSWQWDFGDGNTSNQQNPSHTYVDIGTYTVTLITTGNSGPDSITKVDLIIATNTGVFKDPRDGKTYDIVNIGDQVWFAENLNFEVPDSWWFDNDPANGDVYGRLYTFEAALAACPPGWHIPTDEEWKDLEMFLGMSQLEADQAGERGTDEGEKLKSTSGWNEAGNGTNTAGFMALPGGRGIISGQFDNLSNEGYWWSSTESFGDVWYRRLSFNSKKSIREIPDGTSNTLAFSERVVRD